MLNFNSLSTPLPIQSSVAVTIGNFDGVHRAHKELFSKMKKLAQTSVVVTFTNHPKQVLGRLSPFMILSTDHKMKLLEEQGIDATYALSFSVEFSKLTPIQFLCQLKQATQFTHLVLGHDAALGRDRSGTSDCLLELSKELHFELHSLNPLLERGEPISSSRIRSLISHGKLEEARALLGRPYSILNRVERGNQIGRMLGFKTANLSLNGLTLPPYGVYVLRALVGSGSYYGFGNLGCAPTLNQKRDPILEAHLFDFDSELYGQQIEIELIKFLRAERIFSSTHDLKNQIEQDLKESLDFIFVNH